MVLCRTFWWPNLKTVFKESNDSADAPTGRAYLPVSEEDSVTTSDKFIPNQPLYSDTEISEPSVVVSPPPTTTVLSSLSSPAVDSTSDDDSMVI